MTDTRAVLIVDDTHASLKVLSDLLTAEGIEVHPADSGALALASVAANPPALILLDVLMPEMDGFEVLRRLKADPHSRHIPVMFITALTEQDRRVEGLKLGAVDFISKPFQHEELLARVKTHLELSQLRAGLEQRVEERTQELRQALEQLARQEKLAVLGQMAGSVGHELRNPLAVIRNAVYFLKLVQPEADEKVKEYIGIIESETHNAEKIINDLLDFSRIKSVDSEPLVVADIVRSVLERYPVPEGISVRLDLPETLPRAYADPRQVSQVLGNLVVNACQTMIDGGELTISAAVQNAFIAIAVKDTGVGITPENMQKIFEPLFTTKAEGIGLGLAVSQKLAEANGGKIDVQSEPGKGSTFTVWLPVKP
jgi:signal transduction histidine kinase